MERDKWLRRSLIGLILACFLSFPLLSSSQYILHIAILCIIWSIVASAWNLIMGYAGVTSFGQLAFFTIGAYAVGLLNKYGGVSPWLGIFFSGIFPAVIGLLIGILCLRLRGIYILLITLGMQEIVPVFILWQTKYTGGSVGFSDMPVLAIGSYSFGTNAVPYYYTALFFAALFCVIIYKIIHSPVGLAFVALRDSENFARTLGVNDYKYKVLVFVISAFITGVMGALYGLYIRFATPSLCGWEYVIILLIAIFLGGEGRFPGEIIGTFFIMTANELLQGTSELRDAALGVTVILVVFLMPEGIMAFLSRKKASEERGGPAALTRPASDEGS
jgi:branched-chain amino acid transport system permease protein